MSSVALEVPFGRSLAALQPGVFPLRHGARGLLGPEVHGAPPHRHGGLRHERAGERLWLGQRGEHLDHGGYLMSFLIMIVVIRITKISITIITISTII